ncbi:MAG TPA: phenylalanine--tRNA ligase subunit alpha, partial [Afifellaceae bacterium]|nr:phenylalanine--tRNA ligase subunit alpha [Afifellaceae bacterium]
MADLDNLEKELLAAIEAAGDERALDEVRVAALGKKGSVSEKMKTLGGMSPEERKVAGPALNSLKARVTEAVEARRKTLAETALEERLKSETIDVTLPVRPQAAGTIHPVTQVMEEVIAIFADMGFS